MSEMSAKMELLNFLVDSFKQAKTLAEENDNLRAENAALRERVDKLEKLLIEACGHGDINQPIEIVKEHR